MRCVLAPVLAASGLLTWASPAAALDCVDVVELMDAGVSQSVMQRIVLDSPPVDGWLCLDATVHAVADLDMAEAFLRLHPTRELAWQVRFKQCDAGLELRRSTRRLWAEEGEPTDEVESETLSCRRASALREAITADSET